MHELPTLDELIDGDPRPEGASDPELESLREALSQRDDAHRATLDRLREALLASEPSIDPAMVTGETLAEMEASFAAARTMLARVRARLKPFVPEGTSMVDELIAERRAEAARENETP